MEVDNNNQKCMEEGTLPLGSPHDSGLLLESMNKGKEEEEQGQGGEGIPSCRSNRSSGYDSYASSEQELMTMSPPSPTGMKDMEMEVDDKEMVEELSELEKELMTKSEEMVERSEMVPDKEMISLSGVHVLQQIIADQSPVDTILSCADGKVGAHRIILVAGSPFFKNLLQHHRMGELATIIIPDLTTEIMKFILHFCYTGMMVFTPDRQEEVVDAMDFLMFSALKQMSLKKIRLSVPNSASVANPSEPILPSSVGTGNVVKQEGPLSPVPDPQDQDATTEDEDEDEEDKPYPKEILEKAIIGIQTTASGGGEDGTLFCSTCPWKTMNRLDFVRHARGHKGGKFMKVLESPNISDVAKLSYCEQCNEQYSNPYDAEKCLSDHGLSKCYSCLQMLKKEELIPHYESAHGMKSQHGTVAKCRWCNLGVVISANGILLKRHAKSFHLDQVVKSSKKGGRGGRGKAKDRKSKSQSRAGDSSSPRYSLYLKPQQKNLQQDKDNPEENKTPPSSSKSRGIPSIFDVCIDIATKRGKYSAPRDADDSCNWERMAPPTKKRKIDGSGNPLQLARRTGGSPQWKKPEKVFLQKSMRFQQDFPIQLSPKDNDTQKPLLSSDFHPKKVPKLRVHLEQLTEQEILQHTMMKKEENKDQDS